MNLISVEIDEDLLERFRYGQAVKRTRNYDRVRVHALADCLSRANARRFFCPTGGDAAGIIY